MQVGLFSSNGQIKCGICERSFKNCRVVQLACSHILHDDCFSSSVKNCPSCSTQISDRTIKKFPRKYREKLSRDFDVFFEKFSKDISCKLYGDAGFAKEKAMQFIADGAPHEVLLFFRRILRLFSEVGLDGVVQGIFTKWIKHEIENEPLESIPDVLQELCQFAERVKAHGFSQGLFSDLGFKNTYIEHFEGLFIKAFQDLEIQDMLFKKRTEYWVEFRCKSTFERCIAMIKMTGAQFSLIEHCPEARCYTVATQNVDKLIVLFVFCFVLTQMNFSSYR